MKREQAPALGVAGRRPKKSGRRWRAALAGGLGAAALLVVLLVVPVGRGLTVRDGETGALLLALPLADGESFDLRYTHSVNRSDVTDTIVRHGDTLMCTQTLFTAYGVGIPVLADGIGTAFQETEDGFLITGIDNVQTSIPLLTQEYPNQRILLRDREISLVETAGSGRLLVLAVGGLTLPMLLRGRP